VKQFTYRGVLRTFSNRYHFDGSTPSSGAVWTILSDAIVTAEKALYPPLASAGAKIIQSVGYAPGSEIPVFTHNYTTDGTLPLTGLAPLPGDCAGVVRYSTAGRSSKNHPIYLWNYYHAAQGTGVPSTADNLYTSQKTALDTYAGAWVSGFSDGSVTRHRAGPNGDLATGFYTNPLVSHRDLPR
jgi:hypothetical protein